MISSIEIKDYPNLSAIFNQFWNVDLKTFAVALFKKKPVVIEPTLLSAFKKEWLATGWDNSEVEQAIKQINEIPVIQTSHHITPTNGPTFFSLDLICLNGLAANQLYIVGAYSGVPFSNSAWSGSLSYQNLDLRQLLDKNSSNFKQVQKSADERLQHGSYDERYNLISARQRDQMVYGSEVTDQILEKYLQLNGNLRDSLPELKAGTIYSRWAANCCEKIQRCNLSKENIFYFDINQVICHYLIDVLNAKNKKHPIIQILFEKQSKQFWEIFSSYPAFLGGYRGKKSNKIENLFWKEGKLEGKKNSYEINKRQDLIALLIRKEICPGILLTFMILKFINGIRCLGSFNQIEYMENISRKLQNIRFDQEIYPVKEKERMLTTGRLLQNGKPYWPLDLYVNNQKICVSDFQNIQMGDIWEPIVNLLTGK